MIEPLTETERAYLAGFFDGEGCVHIAKKAPRVKIGGISPEHKLMVVFAQSEESCLRHWRDRLDMGRVYSKFQNRPGHEYTKTPYVWQLVGREAEAVLRQMLPYLVIKKDQAELALKFRITQQQQTTPHKYGLPLPLIELREEYRLSLVALKKTGEPIKLRPELAIADALMSSQMELPGFDLIKDGSAMYNYAK